MNPSLHQILGLAPPTSASVLSWHALLLEGFDSATVRQLAQHLNVTQKQLLELVAPGEAPARNKRLGQEASNMLYRIGLALRQLGPHFNHDMKQCAMWLRAACPALRGNIPILLLRTQMGAEYVFAAIERLAPGGHRAS